MKKGFLIIILLCAVFPCIAQVKALKNIDVFVNAKENTHLIFTSDIKYFNSEQSGLGCDRPSETTNIVRMRAKTDSMKVANVVVATADGQIYSFVVKYKKELFQSTYFVGTDISKVADTIQIDKFNAVHLIFEEPLTYIDRGLQVINLERDETIKNIVKITASDSFEGTTNISVGTPQNFYTFNVSYDEGNHPFSYAIGSLEGEGKRALLDSKILTDQERQDIVDSIEKEGRKIYHLGKKKNKIEFSIQNIFIRKDKLIFRINIKNESNIKYDARNMLFEITDTKISKRTTSQDNDRPPLFVDSTSKDFYVEGKSEVNFIVCFDKFTIPDKKVFHIYIDEQGGGRMIDFSIKNNDLINAQSL